jgi:hypothetical protein
MNLSPIDEILHVVDYKFLDGSQNDIFVIKCRSLATMLNNPSSVQFFIGFGFAKPFEPMTPPHPQIAWAPLLT